MRTIMAVLVATLLQVLTFSVTHAQHVTASNFLGAWEQVSNQVRTTMICSDKFFSVAIYHVQEKKFIGTYGGAFHVDGKDFIEKIEYNTIHTELVGKELNYTITSMKNGKLVLLKDKDETVWNKVDDGKPGALAGAWLITGRMVGDEIQSITPGARKTMKILSGTHFQWIAYNSETKEFFGSGGGTYTTIDGKYTESLLFFSRDNSRVGANLQFDFSLENGKWRHKGLSSKGDPIDEVWTKREELGL